MGMVTIKGKNGLEKFKETFGLILDLLVASCWRLNIVETFSKWIILI